MKNDADIEYALKTFVDTKAKYTRYRSYYDGEQDVAFETDKFKTAVSEAFKAFAETFNLNLCPAVCDALKDKLIIENFRVEAGDADLQTTAWKIWQNNFMDIRSDEVHDEAIVAGDAYVQVWVNLEKKVTIYPQTAMRCLVVYDEETPGRVLWAAKYWLLPNKRMRLNLFYAKETQKYISKKEVGKALPQKAADFVSYTDEGSDIVNNPYGRVPIFHFANNGKMGQGGKSELVNAIPVQNSLNRTVLDKFVAMQFASFLQRWATGIESNEDDDGNPISPYIAGVEKIWMSENTDAKFGVFPATDLTQFLAVKNSAIIDMARVTGTPLWYFVQTEGGFPSGEALKKSQDRHINKIKNRMKFFGQVWADVISFALEIENAGQDIRLFTDWIEPEPISRKEDLENIILEKEIGISEEQALIEAGYGESDIAKMMQANAAKADAMIQSFNDGEEE